MFLDKVKKVKCDGKNFFKNNIIKNKRCVKYKRDGFKRYIKKDKFNIKNINLRNINLKKVNLSKINLKSIDWSKLNPKNIKFSKLKNNQVNKSLVTKVFDYVILGEICLFVLLTIIGACSVNIAFGIWKHFIIPFYNFIYCTCQYLTFKLGSFVLSPFTLCLIIFILSLFVLLVVTNIKFDSDKKDKFINKVRCISDVCIFIIIFNLGLSTLTLNNPRLDEMYYKKQLKNKYSVDDIIKLEEDMKNKVIEYARMMSRDKNGEIIYNGDIVSTSSDSLEELSSKFDILEGPYIKKMYHFDNYNFSNDPSTTGYIFLDNVGVSYEQGLPQTINTVTHELCHTKGISRENEAVLCSIAAGIESKNIVNNYAAYLEAYFRVSDALYLIDEDKARSHENELHDLCINDGYKEMCQFYRKDLSVYVEGSNSISIATYKLKSYDKEYINELIDSLKEFKPKLYINNKDKIKRDELDKYFESENDYLVIQIKNSENDFIKSKKIIEKYASRLKSVKQPYDGMYTVTKMKKKEAIKYYTSVVPSSNVFTRNKDKVFDYSRVVRLLLEYFDSKNV